MYVRKNERNGLEGAPVTDPSTPRGFHETSRWTRRRGWERAINVSANCRFAFSFVGSLVRSLRPPTNNRRRAGCSTVLRASPPPSSLFPREFSSSSFWRRCRRRSSSFPLVRSEAMSVVSEVVVAAGDVSNTRHSNILCFDDFGSAPLHH